MANARVNHPPQPLKAHGTDTTHSLRILTVAGQEVDLGLAGAASAVVRALAFLQHRLTLRPL